MLRNYFKIAWRNLWKHKVFSAINIGGMAIGLTAFGLITLHLANELSFDRYHKDADRIYRVVSHAKFTGGNFDITATPSPFAATLKRDYPEVEETVRIDKEGGGILGYNNNYFKEDAIIFADSTFFTIFSYTFLYGDKNTALNQPQSIVITYTLAKKLFSDPSKALGKNVYFENKYATRVTGVIQDIPSNSNLLFKAIRSFPSNLQGDWGQLTLITYIKLKAGADIKNLSAAMPRFIKKYIIPEYSIQLGKLQYNLEFQPLTSIHLHSNLQYELSDNGSMTYIYVFSIIGILILLIAVINYINLSTAQAFTRLKEIGVRKVTGSSKTQLLTLFFTDSVLISAIATLIAFVLILTAMPWYNQITGIEIDIWHFGIPIIPAIILFSIFLGLISGIYPALFLSGFRLIPALKGEASKHGGTILFRRSLVIFQFIITICMISASLIIYKQLGYVMKKDLGFNKDQLLTFHLESNDARKKLSAFKSQLLTSPYVKSVAGTGLAIGNNLTGLTSYQVNATEDPEQKSRLSHILSIDEDYLPTLGLSLVAGRNYSKQLAADKDRSIIVNETLAKDAGLENPIGKEIFVDDSPYNIIGVVKDFNFASLQNRIEPLVLSLPKEQSENDNLYLRIDGKNVPEALQFIERTYKKFDTGSPFLYTFLDDDFARQYNTERRQGTLILGFTYLSIIIACLGLFGLVTFMVEQRIKEIGIRKVLGASVVSLLKLLSIDLLKLVLLAAMIAFPIAWWAMQKWLEDFAFRIELDGSIFLIAGVSATLIALLTISIQSIKAALSNPVKNLKTE